MMNRRWFFTATGSAFLAAACTVVQQPVAQSSSTEVPQNPNDQFRRMLDAFFFGFEDQLRDMTKLLEEDQLPGTAAGRRARLEGHLHNIYWPRFDHRWKMGELGDDKYGLRLDQACVLGQLTALAFAYESGTHGDPEAWSYEKPDPRPTLGEKHIQWARDSYGLYTNTSEQMEKRKRPTGKKRPFDLCGEPGGPTPPRRQINQPCPFCFA